MDDGWIDGRMDDGWIDGRMDGLGGCKMLLMQCNILNGSSTQLCGPLYLTTTCTVVLYKSQNSPELVALIYNNYFKYFYPSIYLT